MYIMPISSEEILGIQATIECRLTLKGARDMMKLKLKCTVQISTHNTAQSFGKFD